MSFEGISISSGLGVVDDGEKIDDLVDRLETWSKGEAELSNDSVFNDLEDMEECKRVIKELLRRQKVMRDNYKKRIADMTSDCDSKIKDVQEDCENRILGIEESYEKKLKAQADDYEGRIRDIKAADEKFDKDFKKLSSDMLDYLQRVQKVMDSTSDTIEDIKKIGRIY